MFKPQLPSLKDILDQEIIPQEQSPAPSSVIQAIDLSHDYHSLRARIIELEQLNASLKKGEQEAIQGKEYYEARCKKAEDKYIDSSLSYNALFAQHQQTLAILEEESNINKQQAMKIAELELKNAMSEQQLQQFKSPWFYKNTPHANSYAQLQRSTEQSKNLQEENDFLKALNQRLQKEVSALSSRNEALESEIYTIRTINKLNEKYPHKHYAKRSKTLPKSAESNSNAVVDLTNTPQPSNPRPN